MPKIIGDWLGTRLGVLLETNPQNFGRNTKDGKLLGKLLYSYGVIPLQVMEKMKDCKTCYECYNNLAILKPWLTHIGVIHDNSTLEKMAGGEGSAALSVFYSLYLNLERKDRLCYIAGQKERRFTDNGCSRFQVDWVPEIELKQDPPDTDSATAMPLIEKQDMIELHREKCKEVVERIKQAKKKFRKMTKKEGKLGPVVSKSATSQLLEKRKMEAEGVLKDMGKFSEKYQEPCDELNYNQLLELKNKYTNKTHVLPSLSEARTILSNIKRRRKGEVYAQNFQYKMQEVLLDEQWKQIVERQDRHFEDSVCSNLLKQSQYEKQMANKLHLIKHQKKVMAESRRKLEFLKIEQRQKEYDDLVQERTELRHECYEEEEFEKERIAELHRRLYDAKARARNNLLREESRKICEALVDIAIRIGEIRELTACQIPKAFMKDMKELFVKDLSIFDLLDHFEELYEDNKVQVVDDTECFGEGGEGDFYQFNSCHEKLKRCEMERQNVLDECDLRDYLQLSGPWMVELLFPDNSQTEGRHLVLGYVVHKLLELKYPCQSARPLLEIKPMKPVVVVQGLSDSNALNMLIDLMELCRILVVRIEDAINFVLLAYKEELSVVRDIDINFQKVTSDVLKENPPANETEEKRKVQLLKKMTPEVFVEEDECNVADKQTQTPRMIPEDDPLLSPNAEIGKQAFEALGGGDPVPDHVIISAIAAYVKSKEEDYDGWVLINYPLLYCQARELEYSLTGYYALPDFGVMESLESVEGFSYRGPWAEPFVRDDYASSRESRLVPKPECLVTVFVDAPKSYFHGFIKMRKLSSTPRVGAGVSEPEFGPLEKFYIEQDVLLNFEYDSLNFATVKSLGKSIIGNDNDAGMTLGSKTSVEWFGNGVLELNEKWEPKKKVGKEVAGGVKKVTKEVVDPSMREEMEEMEEMKEGKEEMGRSSVKQEHLETPKPGEPGWEWAKGPQPEAFLISLACFWENMEAVYLEDFKNVFFSLRVHRANVLDYSRCIRQSVGASMRIPDEKQKVLSDFQHAFNHLDPDLRPDVDIKCELHVRVSELERALMAIADERKTNLQKDVMKVAQNGWVPDEMANITNIYLTALQLEADRCVDSVQVVMDYYVLMLQKIPVEKPVEKIIVPKLDIQDRKYWVTNGSKKSATEVSPRTSEMKRGRIEQGREKPSKTKSLTDKRRRSSEGSILPGAAEVITEILTSLRLPEDSLTPFHNFFIDNVDIITTDVKNLLEGCLVECRKNDKPLANVGKAGKNEKKGSETKVAGVSGNIVAEWSTALENEMERFFFRAKLLLSRGLFEMNEFLTTILNILSSLTDDIKEIYLREIHSISECCKVFRCSIEEEKGILPQLELKQEEFIVNVDVLLYSVDGETVPHEDACPASSFVFTVEQLALLRSKLQVIAPEGEIAKRSLMYIFEDLKSLSPEVAGCSFFSTAWMKAEPDVASLIDEIYLNLEIVHWKDFIIYGLDLPVPTDADILNMRSSFRKYDPLVTELVSRECYEKVKFWFENLLTHSSLADRFEKAKNLLFEMYQVDNYQTNYSALLLAFCKDEDPVNGFVKALTLAQGEKISRRVSERTSLMEEDAGEYLFGEHAQRDSSTSWESSSKHCCPVNVPTSCIPKEKIRCTCRDAEKSGSEEGVEDEGEMVEQGGEDASIFFDFSYRSGVSLVSFEILNSLFKASFPSLSQLSVLLDCSLTFQETLNSVYDSLEPIGDKVEVGKLIRHPFIDRLLHSTNKFKFLSLSRILLDEATNRDKTLECSSDRLDITKCFH